MCASGMLLVSQNVVITVVLISAEILPVRAVRCYPTSAPFILLTVTIGFIIKVWDAFAVFVDRKFCNRQLHWWLDQPQPPRTVLIPG
jgi:ABC-type cobalamin transport system permease subunit